MTWRDGVPPGHYECLCEVETPKKRMHHVLKYHTGGWRFEDNSKIASNWKVLRWVKVEELLAHVFTHSGM